MPCTSGVVLAAILERRFGIRWARRWQALADEETRWLALYLADRCSTGATLRLNEDAILAIMTGRTKLPRAQRSDRSAASILCTLRAAQLWPLPPQEIRLIPPYLTQPPLGEGLGLNP
jgi:hypothetical protein